MRRSRDKRTPEVQALRAELERLNLFPHQLAEAIRVHPRALENEMSRGMKSIPMGVRIENHLGMPFWTSAEKFNRRRRITEKFGVDPWLLTLRQLRRRATEARIPGRGYAASKAALIDLITEVLLTNPTDITQPIQPTATHTDDK